MEYGSNKMRSRELYKIYHGIFRLKIKQKYEKRIKGGLAGSTQRIWR